MRFVLEIDCDNSAFHPDGGDPSPEIARILHDLADNAEHVLPAGDGKVRDINGNTVGAWSVA